MVGVLKIQSPNSVRGIRMQGSFFFITSEFEFQEADEKGARVLATFMELDTPSTNNRIYRIEEGESIAKSLIGKPIRFGADWLGRHIKQVPQIGIVESAFQEGKKIKGIVRIWEKSIVETLKAGTKYLFSVGGIAKDFKIIQEGKRIFTKLIDAICTHLQLLPETTPAGFPTAKMHKVIEINESCMICECQHGSCPVLKGISSDFEEAKKIKEAKEKVLSKAVLLDIIAIAIEPWEYM